jgi:hypothetical protein
MKMSASLKGMPVRMKNSSKKLMMDVVVNSSLVLDIGTCDLPLVDI